MNKTTTYNRQIRCGTCGRFARVTVEWRGPSRAEVVECDHCEGRASTYSPLAAAIDEMSAEEQRRFAEGEHI